LEHEFREVINEFNHFSCFDFMEHPHVIKETYKVADFTCQYAAALLAL
jgi:hypothetical protein